MYCVFISKYVKQRNKSVLINLLTNYDLDSAGDVNGGDQDDQGVDEDHDRDSQIQLLVLLAPQVL